MAEIAAALGRGSARREIARLVLSRGQMSKAEIEAALDYSHPTVINTVGALVSDGVLRESGEFDSTGGRKAKVIAPNPSYRYFGGIDITRNHVTEVVVDWTGKAAAKRRRREAFSPDASYISCVAESFFSFAAEDGWAMRKYGRPDRAVNGTEPLSGLSASQGTELCATAEHILSAQVALETLGDADIADDMEVAAYNTLPATLAPDGRGMRYFCLLNQPCCIDGKLLYNNGQGKVPNVPGPYSGFGCCRSNFHFAWPKFAESMWMKREDGLAATAYGDCIVKTPIATIAETGGYPFSDGVRLEIVEAAGGEWPLFVRIPGRCKDAKVKVNGADGGCARAGSFMRLARKWKKGDVVELSFPSKPAVTHWKDDSIAVMRGPLLYALKIDEDEKARNAADWPAVKKDASDVLRDVELGFPMKELRPKSPWNYALVADGANGEPQFHVKGEGLGLRLAVKAVRTGYAGWGTMMADASARAEDPPPSPVPAAAVQGKAETIELAPIALTQLRITLFPWIK